MTWPVGYGRPGVAYRASRSGALFANDVPVSNAEGWLEVRSVPSAVARGAPVVVEVRIKLSLDARRQPYFFATEVRAGGRHHAAAGAIAEPWAEPWLATLADALHAEIDRRVENARRAANAPTRRVNAASGNRRRDTPTIPQPVYRASGDDDDGRG